MDKQELRNQLSNIEDELREMRNKIPRPSEQRLLILLVSLVQVIREEIVQ